VAGIVLVDCFVYAAVESEVVLIAFEAKEAAENALSARLLVDTCGDGEVEHRFHFAGAELMEDVSLEWGIEIWGLYWCHDYLRMLGAAIEG